MRKKGVWRSDLQGNRMANRGTSEHVPLETSEEWKQWGTWPGVRHPAPEPEDEIVETARSAALAAAPFAIGPHQHVVEHETYAICLDCQRHVGVHTVRKCFNYHALKDAHASR
eukprot:4832750-Amphidinium_carterae.1